MSSTICTCRACGSSRLRLFLTLGNLPLSDGLLRTEQLATQEPRYPLDVAFCEDCTLVQILETVPPEELFGDEYPYFSSFSDTLVQHSRVNVEARIAEHRLNSRSLAVEIASNDGYLLQFYRTAGVPCLGIDPAAGPVQAARARGIETLHAFFGPDMAKQLATTGRTADIVHANNVLAHVADTNGFVHALKTILKGNGVGVIEVPYVKDLIDHNEFDTIYHEHLCYFSLTALVRLFRRHGLFLNRVERLNIHGGSLRLFVQHLKGVEPSVRELLAEEHAAGLDRPEYYATFAERICALKQSLCDLLLGLKKQGASIAGYGAAAKGTILLNYAGLGADTLDYVADRNVHKQGRWIPGIRLPIVSPEQLLVTQPDYLLILPWNFKEEIIQQQAEYRRRGGQFIVPVPEPVLV